MERQASTLALRFISGKYQGGEYPLGASPEVVVGRSNELDMVLAEDMVSRRHARILCEATDIVIEDLGSTNGTFVNGEKIQRAKLKEGDRVLIGTSILKVVRLDPAAPLPRKDSSTLNTNRNTRTMTGSIDEIPLPDLLQLLGTSKKSGVLIVRSDEDVGRIHLKKGVVTFAIINDLEVVQPLKSLFRILTWVHGSFELAPPDEALRPNDVSVGVHELLLEGLRQIDELNMIRGKIPSLDAALVVPKPLQPRLAALQPTEMDIFQLAHNHGVFAAVLNQSQASDLDTARVVLKLLDSGYLATA